MMMRKLSSWLSNPPEWFKDLIVHTLLTIPLTVSFVALCAYIYGIT